MKYELTPRELEVLKLIASGLTSKEVAENMLISKTTVITHIEKLKRKLNCKNCPELTFKAAKMGLI